MQVPRRGNAKVVVLVIVVILAVMGVVCAGLAAVVLIPAFGQARIAAERMESTNNMKMIGLALHNYHDTYGSFPPAFIADEGGRPMHSWRVLILPFIEEQLMYDQYDFDQPWDSPHNLAVCQETPLAYQSAPIRNSAAPEMTSYVAVVGPNTAINSEKAVRIRDIVDGTSNTLAVVEDTTSPVPWNQPVDIAPQAFLAGDLDAGYFNGANILMTDGSVRFFTQADKTMLAPMTTIGQGD